MILSLLIMMNSELFFVNITTIVSMEAYHEKTKAFVCHSPLVLPMMFSRWLIEYMMHPNEFQSL